MGTNAHLAMCSSIRLPETEREDGALDGSRSSSRREKQVEGDLRACLSVSDVLFFSRSCSLPQTLYLIPFQLKDD